MHTYVYIFIFLCIERMYMALYCWRLFSKSLESLGYVMKQSELFGSPAMVWAFWMQLALLLLELVGCRGCPVGGLLVFPCRGVECIPVGDK